jgi:hypothetical protein
MESACLTVQTRGSHDISQVGKRDCALLSSSVFARKQHCFTGIKQPGDASIGGRQQWRRWWR